MKKLLIILTLGLMFGQTEMETRIYSFDFNVNSYEEVPFDIESITGYDLEYALINFIDIESNYNAITIDFQCSGMNASTFVNLSGFEPNVSLAGQMGSHLYHSDRNCQLINISANWHQSTLTVSITGEFPIEDTGYMEEDFDFCINEGLNLVSYPCENDIAINDALPSEISNNLSSIVGEGVAGVNNNGTWVGSLTQLQAGSGYWFKSSIEACFNYDCEEN